MLGRCCLPHTVTRQPLGGHLRIPGNERCRRGAGGASCSGISVSPAFRLACPGTFSVWASAQPSVRRGGREGSFPAEPLVPLCALTCMLMALCACLHRCGVCMTVCERVSPQAVCACVLRVGKAGKGGGREEQRAGLRPQLGPGEPRRTPPEAKRKSSWWPQCCSGLWRRPQAAQVLARGSGEENRKAP